MSPLNHSNKVRRLFQIAISWNVAFFFTCGIYANPVLDNIVSGNASVSQNGNTTTINQGSQKAIINWNSFNVGNNEAVRFNQPNGGVTLNRINPNQGASQIYGQITANGQVILVNPAGVFFGPGSYVNVGGLIATTNNISDANFLNGQYHFENSGYGAGAIINQGQIIAANNGLIALVGNNVRNDGLIEANVGKVVLASGEAFTMNLSGNDLISFTVDTPTSKNARDENGNEMRDGVKNTGLISANGGTVLISANTAKGVLDHAINLEGIVEAKSVGTKNGSIILYADNQSGSVTRLAGKMDVSGKNQGETGGKIEVSSSYILTDSTARLDASGDAGGGVIRIGGNKHGEGPLENATANVVLSGAELNADAIHSGNGGEVILWANDVTRYYGSIYARGGANAGNGGFVEVSGKNLLDFNGQVNTTAANGQRGMLLLDPKNIIIAASGGSSYNNGVNNLFANNSSGDSIIDPNSLNIGTDITLQANNDITVTDAINMTGSGNALYLQAGRTLSINNDITVNGNLYATANDSNAVVANRDAGAGSITLASGRNINVGSNLAQFIINTTATGGFTPGSITLNATSTVTAGTATFNTLNASTNGAITLAGNIAASSAVNVSYGASSTISGVLSGAGSLNIAGSSGTLTLSGNNTYTGATNINSGTLRTTVANALFDSTAVTVASGATYNLNSVSDTIGSLAGAGSVTLGSATLSTGGNNTSTNFSGVISGTGGLVKQGTGTMNLSGTNTYGGTTSIQNGVLQLGANQTLHTISLTNASGVSLDLNNYNLSMTNLSGGGSLGGSVNIGSGTLTMAPTNNTFAFAGGFSGNGNIIKNSIYRLDVGGTSSFTGTTTINDGVLRTTTSTALGTTGSTILVNSGANLTAWYQYILGNVQLNGGTLEISQSGGVAGNVALLANSSYSAAGIGTISGSISGNYNLTVNGGYQLFLTGNNSGFMGGLILNNADTYIQNVNALGSSAVTLNGGTLLFRSQVAGATFANNFNVNNSSSNVYVQSGTVTLSGALSGSSTFNKGQSGALTLSGNNSGFSGAININGGTLTAANANALGDTSNGVTIASGTILNINGVAIGNEAITNNGGSISGTNTASLAGNITLGANSNVGGTGNLTLSGVIDDGVNTYNLTKTGAGSVTLSGANTYDGTTNISVGTLIAANNNALGSTTGGTVLSSGAVLNLNNAAIGNETITTGGDSSYSISSTGNSSLSGNIILGANSNLGGDGNLTLTGIISDGGLGYSVYKKGTGTLTLSGVNTYTGNTVVNAGILSLTASNVVPSSSLINVTSGGTLQVNNMTLNNALSLNGTGSAGLGALYTSGTVNLNGAVTLTGDTLISTSTGSDTLNFSNTINGAYALTLSGGGTTTLGGSVGNTTALTSLTSNNALHLGTASTTNVYQTTGAQAYNSTVNYLGSNATHTASSIYYGGALTGSNTALTSTASSGSLTFNNGAIVKSLVATGASGIYINNENIETQNGQTYNNAVTLGNNTTFTMTGTGDNSMSFLNGIYGGYATTLEGTGSGNYSFNLTGPLTGTYNVLGTSGGNNTLTVSSNSYQTININGLNSGVFASSNIGGLSFSDIQNITGGSQGNAFVFANNATMSGTVDGGSLSNDVTNTLNFANYTSALKVTFTSFNAGTVQNLNNLSQVALFNRINNIQNASTPNHSSITLSSQANQQVTISASMTGSIMASPGIVNFSNFQSMTSINSGDSVTITPNTGGTVNYTDQTVTYSNGVMSFLGFANFDLANQTNQIAQVVNQPEDNTTTDNGSAITTSSNSTTSSTDQITQPIQENTDVLVGPACY